MHIIHSMLEIWVLRFLFVKQEVKKNINKTNLLLEVESCAISKSKIISID